MSGPTRIETCRRCGECCRRSSPTLHSEDVSLFRTGALSLADVYTLRKGEFAHDTIRGGLVQLDAELIKVREDARERRCAFFSGETGCRIYAFRPLQCRTLECWNPDPLVHLFSGPKLQRRDIVTDPRMIELVAAHEERASYRELGTLLERFEGGGTDQTPILDILNYDLHVRKLVAERLSLENRTMPFYFGRPMIECLRGFGYRVEGSAGSGYSLLTLR